LTPSNTSNSDSRLFILIERSSIIWSRLSNLYPVIVAQQIDEIKNRFLIKYKAEMHKDSVYELICKKGYDMIKKYLDGFEKFIYLGIRNVQCLFLYIVSSNPR
jgi:hypothetical protein